MAEDRTSLLSNIVRPDFLSTYVDNDKSLEGMDEHKVLPRLKVVQSMAAPELKKQFPEGSAILHPGGVSVWKDGDEPFKFIPQLWFPEYAKWSDMRDSQSDMIVEQSFDPMSDIARKSRDPQTRKEVYEGQENVKDPMCYEYIEHHRFAGVIYGDHELAGVPVTISFERGEHFQGRQWLTAIKMRKQEIEKDSEMVRVPIPLWAQVWEFTVGLRERGESRRWFGLDFANPSVISEDDVAEMHRCHLELKDAHKKSLLRVEDSINSDVDDDQADF